jgi:hypothetical protein
MAEVFLRRYHYHRPHMGRGMIPPLSNKEGDCEDIKVELRVLLNCG